MFVETSLTHRTLGPVTQAGLVNNLNDGMLWTLLPLLLLTLPWLAYASRALYRTALPV